MWKIEKVQISGGFLPGLELSLSPGLTCIIGPRGSGKSTFAEMLRFAICGSTGATKQRTDLLQANIGATGLITLSVAAEAGSKYTVRRGLKQSPVLITADGRTITSVDLDRGSFLPLDAYSSFEVEAIADEALGAKRRALLDELVEDQLKNAHLSISDRKRQLDANADHIRSLRRKLLDVAEHIEEIGDVRARLNAMEPQTIEDETSSAEYTKAVKQQQYNQREQKQIDVISTAFTNSKKEVALLSTRIEAIPVSSLHESASSNAVMLETAEKRLAAIKHALKEHISKMAADLEAAEKVTADIKRAMTSAHTDQGRLFSDLQEEHRAVNETIREKTELEGQLNELEELETDKVNANAELDQALKQRAKLKAEYLLEREQISNVREDVATRLQADAGGTVRIRVMRNGDDLAYRQHLTDALKGARVRNHEEIIDSLLRLRPEQLAQFIHVGDAAAFDELVVLGSERSRKVLEAFKENIDPLQLEIINVQDRIKIELNVSSGADPIYKDAADLSRGQTCTALLPLLLARRDAPLIIDQPEDNLDNHFIYETVVNSIKRMKQRRQMIFITHNANIPVLAGADQGIVMNSHGKVGFVRQNGTVDQCRNQIIDLLA